MYGEFYNVTIDLCKIKQGGCYERYIRRIKRSTASGGRDA